MALLACYEPASFSSANVTASRLVHPEDRAQFQHELREFRLSGEERWTVDPFRIVTERNETIWLRGYAARIFNDPDPDHFVAFAVDITRTHELLNEGRLTSERLGNVIDGTNVGTWEWDVLTGDLVINNQWADIVGYTREELEPTGVET